MARARAHGVRLLGPRQDVPRLFAAADVFILPTIYDPFSNATLEALASQSLARGAYEVVVVDSASTDGTRDLCLNRDWPMSLRYAARENAGKCAARNDAIRLAGGRLIFLVLRQTVWWRL